MVPTTNISTARCPGHTVLVRDAGYLAACWCCLYPACPHHRHAGISAAWPKPVLDLGLNLRGIFRLTRRLRTAQRWLLSPSQNLHSPPHPAHPPGADLSQPTLHRRAFSSPLQTAVTSPWKTGLTLSSPPAASQPTYEPSNTSREAGPSGCRSKAPRSQLWVNTAPQGLVATYFASPGDAQWETTAFLLSIPAPAKTQPHMQHLKCKPATQGECHNFPVLLLPQISATFPPSHTVFLQPFP